MHLEELSVIVHEKQQQGLALGSSHFVILHHRSLKGAADQSSVVNLKVKNNQ